MYYKWTSYKMCLYPFYLIIQYSYKDITLKKQVYDIVFLQNILCPMAIQSADIIQIYFIE